MESQSKDRLKIRNEELSDLLEDVLTRIQELRDELEDMITET